jgi:hypothetical protein
MAFTKELRTPGPDNHAFREVRLHCTGLEPRVVDDQDIPFSYILYVIGVITIIAALLVGGFLLWIR